MRIYFLGTFSGGRDLVDNYNLIVKRLEALGHEVLSKQIADKDLDSSEENKTATYIYDRELKKINSCDVIIAEVSESGVGIGYFINHALSITKPVLALSYKPLVQRISIVLEGNPSENLYLDHYTVDSLKSVLKRFLDHIETRKSAEFKGRFIVIEGVDGVGKSTQIELLEKYLINQQKQVKFIKFPRYEKTFGGQMVKRYLNGEFGDQNSISPYLIAPLYAIDRAHAKDEIYDWLKEGNTVIADRYMMSNLAFRSASLDLKQVDEYLEWNNELEYNVLKIPREDVVVFLYAPLDFVWQKLDQKRKGREYTASKRDIHEKDYNYLKEVEKRYLYLTKKYKHIIKIDCVKNKKLRSIEDIHFEILKKLTESGVI